MDKVGLKWSKRSFSKNLVKKGRSTKKLLRITQSSFTLSKSFIIPSSCQKEKQKHDYRFIRIISAEMQG